MQRQHSVHPFWFADFVDKDRQLMTANPRDAYAALFTLSLLFEEGYVLGDAFHDYAPFPFPEEPLPRYEYAQFDTSRLLPGDLLFEATRFPLSDGVRDRKKIRRGFTELEAKLEDFWAQFFSQLDRSTATLTPDVRRSLRAGFKSFAHMEIPVYRTPDVRFVDDGAGYRGTPPQPGTLAFYVRTESAWEGGPGLFSAFAMDGEGTCAWNWMLRHRMPELTRRRGFYMAVLQRPPEYKARGWYSDAASEWTSELVLEHPFDEIY